MKLKIFCFFILLVSWNARAEQEFGLGVLLGDPTGISGQMQITPDNAVDAALAWSTVGFHIHSNYLWQKNGYLNIDRQAIDLFYGVGGRMISITESSNKDRNKTSLAARTPIGLNYKLKQTRLQFFAEIALNLNLVPSTEADLDGGIGMRFYF